VGLLIPALFSGLSFGLLYGLLAFSIVFLFKATGLANFAQGNIGTFATFVVFSLSVNLGWPFWTATVVGALIAMLLGGTLFAAFLVINERAGPVNLTMRTLGMYLLLYALMNEFWALGQPFRFQSWFPEGTVSVLGSFVPWRSFGILAVTLVLLTGVGAAFRWTHLGLLFMGLAENPDVARLLGVNVRLLTALAWSTSAVVSLVVGILTAPTTLLSSEMLEIVLPYAFTAAILGGLTSLTGSIVGGLIVGLVANITAVYGGADLSLFVVFGLLLVTLVVRPNGIWGAGLVERL
jgi:branched-chain amino acid transport system permease protein